MRNLFLLIFIIIGYPKLYAPPALDETILYTIIWYTDNQQPHRQCFIKKHTQQFDKQRLIQIALDELSKYRFIDMIHIVHIEHLKFHIDNNYHSVTYSISKE